MTLSILSPVLEAYLGADPYNESSVQKHPLGAMCLFSDGTWRRYIRAGAAIAVGDALTIDFAEGNNDMTPTTSATTPVHAVAPIAMTDNYFGWVIVSGVASVKAATIAAGGLPLVPTATAGTLDDTVASAALAYTSASGKGVTSLAADSGGLCVVFLS